MTPCVPRSKHTSQAQNAAKKHPASETDGPGQWGGSRLRAPGPPLMVSVPLAGGIRHQMRHVGSAACAVPAHAGQGRAADRWLREGQEGWPGPTSPPRCSGGGFGTPGCVGPEHTLTSGPSTSLELIVVVKASSGSDLQGTAELLFKSQLV